MFYGITCSQATFFLRHFPNDRQFVRRLIAFLWLLDTLHIIFVTHASYWYMVTNFTQSSAIQQIPWSLWASQIMAPTSDLIVRMFFLYRVWILSKKNKWLVYPVVLVSVVPWLDGIALGGLGLARLKTVDEALHFSWMFYLGLGFMTVGDCYFAATLSYFLWQGKSQINTQTNSTVRILMLYTINTGLISTFFSLTCFVTYASLSRTFVYLTMYFPLSQLYINALLATLNARIWLRTEADTVQIPLSLMFHAQNTAVVSGIQLGLTAPTASSRHGSSAAQSIVDIKSDTDSRDERTSSMQTEDGKATRVLSDGA